MAFGIENLIISVQFILNSKFHQVLRIWIILKLQSRDWIIELVAIGKGVIILHLGKALSLKVHKLLYDANEFLFIELIDVTYF